jgi:hypothetical protein
MKRPTKLETGLMDFNGLREAFLQHVIYGEGKDAGKADTYWYRGKIMYYENSPQWRMVPGAQKDWCLLWKGMGTMLSASDNWWHKMVLVKTPDLGVFSRYDQDWCDEGADLNDRVRFIMLQRVRELALEGAIGMNAVQVNNKREGLMKQMKGYYHEYDMYNRHLGCGWPDLPDFYRDRMNQTFDDKVRAYNHPSAVAARERSKARKTAMQALGISPK